MSDPLRTEPRHAASSSGSPGVSPGIAADPGLIGESGRVGTLRGASVSFNPRRLVQAVVGLIMATLAITAIVLTIAGIHSNDLINQLHTQGQPVTVAVTGCQGLLGGSGSNAAGYSCQGTYQLDGHVYHEPLPGSTFYRPGTKLPSIVVPEEPALVSPVGIVNSQQASDSVFVAPIVLGAVLLALVAVLLVKGRPKDRAPTKPKVPVVV